jgi:hypothetical protein
VARYECVAQCIDCADFAIDRQITEHDPVTRRSIATRQGAHGSGHGLTDAHPNGHHSIANFGLVRSETLLIPAHLQMPRFVI